MNLTQQILNGLVLGHAYALVAVGWTVLVGVARSVNFAHGQLYMVSAFVAWFSVFTLGLPYVVAVLIAIASGAILGLIMQFIMMKATLQKNVVSIMIMTLGFGYVVHGGAALIFGSTAQMFDTPISQIDLDFSSVLLTWQDLAIVMMAIAIFVVLKLVIDRTSLGRVVRMVAEDPALSMLAGINVRRMYLLVFAFEGAAVALAAGLVSPRVPILTSMPLKSLTRKTLTDKDALLAALAQIREDEYSWVDGEFDASVCGLSIPVRDASGVPIAALSVNLLSGGTTQARAVRELLRPLRAAAEQLRAMAPQFLSAAGQTARLPSTRDAVEL